VSDISPEEAIKEDYFLLKNGLKLILI